MKMYFAVIDNKVEWSPNNLDHEEWLVELEGYSEGVFHKMVLGHKDKDGIYFYGHKNLDNDVIEQVADEHKYDFGGNLPVYCWLKADSISDCWKQIKRLA